MSRTLPTLRPAGPDDAVAISALAIQVFLDTYATEGVRPDLAREAFGEYSEAAFAARLRDPQRHFILAERGDGLVGFAEAILAPRPAPAGDVTGAELVRLYVQPAAQGRGTGRALLEAAERAAREHGAAALWLTAWEGNHRARRFYAARGYRDIGETGYAIQGRTYANRVLATRWDSPSLAGAEIAARPGTDVFAVRVLGAGDAEAMRRLLAVFAAAFEDDEHYLSRQPDDAYLRARLGDPHFVAIAAWAGEAIVGGIAGYVLPKFEQARSEFYLYDLAVAETHRRRGVATALIEALKGLGRQRGWSVIFVQAHHGDDPAIALYTRLGLRADVMHFDIAPGDPDGR